MHLRLIKGLSYDGVVRASAAHPDVFVDDPEKYTALLESGYFEALPDAYTVTGHLDTGFLGEMDEEQLDKLADDMGVDTTGKDKAEVVAAVAEELEPGADDEDDESLRKRVQEKIAGPAENGNQQHYKTWCESISGVGRAHIVPLWAGENTVKGVLIDTEGGPASEAVVQRVQEYIDPGGTGLGEGQANIGAHFTATSATAKRVNISFSVTLAKGGDLASVRSAAQTALKAQIKSINLTTDDSETPTLRISTVGNTIYSLLGVLDYANLRFNGQTANVEAGKEEVFVLGEVTVSETNPVS